MIQRNAAILILSLFTVLPSMGAGTGLELISLFPENNVFQKDGAWNRLYVSEEINPMPMGIVSLATELVAIPDWQFQWAIAPRDAFSDTSAEPFVLKALVSYTGDLKLDRETFLEVAPRVLPVPVRMARAAGLPPPVPRNVVILMIDTLRPDHLPESQQPSHLESVLAPHMSLMAALGVHFEVAYGASSSTRPSIGSIFTGLHPRAHGAVKHAVNAAALYDGCRLLTEEFAERNWHTCSFWTNSQITPTYGFNRGFQEYTGPIDDSQISREAVAWLRKAEPPYYLYLHYLAPHHPYEPGDMLAAVYEGKTGDGEHDRYCGEITLEDIRIGAVWAELARLGQLNDTLVWLISDHGEEFWEHNWKHHGVTLYEESLRTVSRCTFIPRFPPGHIVQETVTHVDIYPSLLELFDWPLTPLAGIDDEDLKRARGISLLPLLEGHTRFPEPKSSHILYGHHNGGLEPGPHESDKQGLIADGRKLIWWPEKNKWEFYNLQDDYFEKHNLLSGGQAPPDDLKKELLSAVATFDAIGETLRASSSPVGEISAEDLENMRNHGYLWTPQDSE